MYVQSLTPEGCFHIHLLKVESLSAIALNLTLRSVCKRVIRDITANQPWSNMHLTQV